MSSARAPASFTQHPPLSIRGRLTHAERRLATGRLEDAMCLAQEAAQLARAEHDAALEIQSLTLVSRISAAAGRFMEAFHADYRCCILSRETQDAASEVAALGRLAIGTANVGAREHAIQFAECASNLARTVADPALEARIANSVGCVHAVMLGNCVSARRALLTGRWRLRHSDEQRQLLVLTGNLGNTYLRHAADLQAKQRPEEARRFLLKAERWLEQAIRLAARLREEVLGAFAMCFLAAALRELKEAERALRRLQSALAVLGSHADPQVAAVLRIQLGMTYLKLGNAQQALTHLQSAHAQLAAHGFGGGESAGQALEAIVSAYEADGCPTEALAAFRAYHAHILARQGEAADRRAQIYALRLEAEALSRPIVMEPMGK